MQNLKVSVVMTVYNGEKFVAKQLESIINQTQTPDEILIFDDRSMDNTGKIIERYTSKFDFIHYFKNEYNVGFVMNFWNGIHKAVGDIIFLSDQDDLWKKDKIKDEALLFDEYPNMLSLNTAYQLIDGQDKPISGLTEKSFKNDGKLSKISFPDFIRSPRYPGMAMAFRKKLLSYIDYDDPRLIHAHDWCLNHTAAFHNGMYFWNKIECFYRQHENNTYGTNANLPKNKMLGRRSNIIKEELQLTNILAEVYSSSAYLSLIKKQNFAIRKRLQAFENGNILEIINTYLKYHKYLALRGLLGDVYTTGKRQDNE